MVQPHQLQVWNVLFNVKEFHFTKENCFALAGAKCRNSCRSVF